MMWKKPQNLKYTDLCIYIDENIPKIAEEGRYPEIENLVYNYLWLVVKALAIKSRMFQKFEDYDPFAFHAATRLFLALRRNYQNQGKIIKGKNIVPIKSCLNYMKAIMYPMKLCYQQEAYREIIDEEFVTKKFDAFALENKMKNEVRNGSEVNSNFKFLIDSTIQSIPKILTNVMNKLPFADDSLEYKHIKMSVLMTCLNSLKKTNRLGNEIIVSVWKLPKSLSSYISVITKEFYAELKKRNS